MLVMILKWFHGHATCGYITCPVRWGWWKHSQCTPSFWQLHASLAESDEWYTKQIQPITYEIKQSGTQV